MMSTLTAGLVQYDIVWEDPSANRARIDRLIDDCDRSFQILILPEMFATGFTMDAIGQSEPPDGETVSWMMQRSEQLQVAICGSLAIEEHGRFYNRFFWVENGMVKATYDKRHLFAKAGEDQHYSCGNENVKMTLGTSAWMPLICYDLRFPVWSRNRGDIDVLLYVANFPAKRKYAWRHLLIARAIENQCFVIGLNRIGVDGNDHEYAGESLVVDPYGNVVADLGDREGLAAVELDQNLVLECRTRLPFLQDQGKFVIEV